MKRLLLALGALGMAIGLSCNWLDWHNNIEYPVGFGLLSEQPGEPITLTFGFCFQDETLDTSGVDFDWSKSGDTLWFLLKGKDGEIDHNESYRSRVDVNVGVLEKGSYTLLLEGERGAQDTLTLTVEDSVYYLSGYDGSVAKLWAYDTLRRLFPDMLHVDVAWNHDLDQGVYVDSLKTTLLNSGAKECSPSSGFYTIFHVSQGGGIGTNVTLTDWDYAWEYGWINEEDAMLFMYEDDTTELKQVFEEFSPRFQALCFAKGSGFTKLYEVWENQ